MLGDIKPFRIAGNLYFVGEHRASSHMIDTGDGLILIDVGYEETADIVCESLNTLGYDVKDVKIILLSHGHYDHSDGVPKIVKQSGAKVYLFREDVKYLKGFLPDVYFRDGDVIRLGNTEIKVLHTPGHTEGVASFFWNVEENGKIFRAGMFGGAGVNQLKKGFLDKYDCSYRLRWHFLQSIQRLRGETVDLFVGNHVGQNKTEEKYARMQTQTENPFIDPAEWRRFLDKTEADFRRVMKEEISREFVNYAHRGASEYCPENTMTSFYQGITMGANGIETDLRRTKDGVIVLFHDDTLERVCGESGSIADYTWDELQSFRVTKNGLTDKIVKFEDFLKAFAWRDLTFAIELKDGGLEREATELIRKYGAVKKTVITSFSFNYIKAFKEYAPEFRVGHLIGTDKIDDAEIERLIAIDAAEICPSAEGLTAELVERWHGLGFRVRAWGMSPSLIAPVCEAGADGMTVNFPDLLTEYRKQNAN